MYIYHLTDIKCERSGRQVLRIDDLRFERGTVIGVKGHNGSGKSTLLRLLALVDLPEHGVLNFGGSLFSLKSGLVQPQISQIWRFRRRVTMLGQESYLLKRSVSENLSYGLQLRGVKISSSELHDRQREALLAVGLEAESYLPRSWRELSGGESQRVALAARLILRPEVLLLDEPTASLDKESSLLVKKAVSEAKTKFGTTIVLVSHDWDWLNSVADRVITLEDGLVVSDSQTANAFD